MKVSGHAPGKVNLVLYLGPPREDGRHQLVTLFESVSLADELELTTPDGLEHDVVECPGVSGGNLAERALGELRRRGWRAPPVALRIDKRIPVAGGMGGGSADAAATLRLAAEVAPLPADPFELARSLGADVPSQVAPGVVLGTGAGEIVERCSRPEAHELVIVPLERSLSTAEVYAEADRLGLGRPTEELRELEQALRLAPPREVINDLEPAARSLCPEIGDALDATRAAGADEAFVCGSGPTVAGLCRSAAEAVARELVPRFPRASVAAPVDADFAAPRRALT